MPDVKRVDFVPLLADRSKTEAMVLAPRFMHRDLYVLVDQGIMDARDPAPYNMALAEEIAHIELHRAVMLEIRDTDDFKDLQRCERWGIAEHDAKYFGRALLMPRHMLEPAAEEVYKLVASQVGYGDGVQFSRVFMTHLASTFEIPWAEAQNRITRYVGGLQERLERSIIARSPSLLSLADQVVVRSPLSRSVQSATQS